MKNRERDGNIIIHTAGYKLYPYYKKVERCFAELFKTDDTNASFQEARVREIIITAATFLMGFVCFLGVKIYMSQWLKVQNTSITFSRRRNDKISYVETRLKPA